MIASGPSAEVIDTYLARSSDDHGLRDVPAAIAALPPDPVLRLLDIRIVQEGRPLTDVVSGKPVVLEITYDILQPAAGFHLYFELRDAEGVFLFESIQDGDAAQMTVVAPGHYRARAVIPADLLGPTSYELSIDAGIYQVRQCLPRPIRIPLSVSGLGRVNRAYPGYRTTGRLAPLLEWNTERRDP